jgi:hypothetical protein
MDIDMDVLAASMAARRIPSEPSLVGAAALREAINKTVTTFNASPKKMNLLNTLIKNLDDMRPEDVFQVRCEEEREQGLVKLGNAYMLFELLWI